MRTKTRLIAAAAVLLLAGLVLVLSTMFRPDAPEIRPADVGSGTPAGEALVSDPSQTPETAAERMEIETPPELRGLEHPYSYELQCLVLDEYGMPIPGVSIELGPAGGERNAAPGTTAPDGTLAIRWTGREPEMDIDLSLGGYTALRRMTVTANSPLPLVLGDSVTTCSNCHGQPAGTMKPQTQSLALRTSDDGRIVFAMIGACGRPQQRGELEMQEEGLHPFVRFTDPLGDRPSGERLGRDGQIRWVLQDGGTFETTVRLELGGLQGSVTPAGEEPPPPAQAAVLEGTVLAADGSAVAGTVVAWGTEPGVFLGRTGTDEKGRFRAEIRAFGTLHVRAGGNDHGLAVSEVALAPGQTTIWTPQLEMGTAVRGVARGTDGKPLSGWRVEFVGIQKPWFDACSVQEDGSFVLPNLPGGMGSLLLWRGGGAHGLPVLLHEAVLPDSGTVRLDLADVPIDGELGFQPAPTAGGADPRSLRARVWQEATGRGSNMRRGRGQSGFSVKGLPAGWYRVEVRSDGLGWCEVARTWVDGKGATDLGPVAVPEPGRLVAAELGVEPAPEIYRRTGDLDLRVPYAAGGGPFPLAPGEYWCLRADAAGNVTQRAFRIRPGESTGLTR